MSAMPPVLTLPAFAAAGIPHGFLTRQGGVSTGLYDSLNCGPGSDDDPAHVAQNRRRAMTAIGMPDASLQSLHQVHGNTVAVVDRVPPGAEEILPRPRADAAVTASAGVVLGILTADCVPILFADPKAGVVGAAHAGWRGALAGVAEATLAAMEVLGAARKRVIAVTGPAIGPESYEVGPDFPTPFLDRDAEAAQFFRPGARSGPAGRHWMFDLPGYTRWRMAAAGIGQTASLSFDTLADERRFFSYRRGSLRGAADYGRQIALIGLPRSPRQPRNR